MRCTSSGDDQVVTFHYVFEILHIVRRQTTIDIHIGNAARKKGIAMPDVGSNCQWRWLRDKIPPDSCRLKKRRIDQVNKADFDNYHITVDAACIAGALTEAIFFRLY